MSKKAVNYGNDYVSKGVAYIRHHIGDRLISDKVVANRNDFNERFWNRFRNSNHKSFFSFLQDNLSALQLQELLSHDKRQSVWIVGITPTIKTSALVVMSKKSYNALDNLTTQETFYACYSSKMSATSANDVFINFYIPEK